MPGVTVGTASTTLGAVSLLDDETPKVYQAMLMIDPWSLLHGARLGWSAYKWITAIVEHPLTFVNNSQKDLYSAICLYAEEGSLSVGWIKTSAGGQSTVGMPVPRVGSVYVAMHARTRKGRTTYTGDGHDRRSFFVAMPQYGGVLDANSAFTVREAATGKPSLFMNQGGVGRLQVVKGRLVKIEGAYTYTYR